MLQPKPGPRQATRKQSMRKIVSRAAWAKYTGADPVSLPALQPVLLHPEAIRTAFPVIAFGNLRASASSSTMPEPEKHGQRTAQALILPANRGRKPVPDKGS